MQLVQEETRRDARVTRGNLSGWELWQVCLVEETPCCVSFYTRVPVDPVMRVHHFSSQLRPSHVLISLAKSHAPQPGDGGTGL